MKLRTTWAASFAALVVLSFTPDAACYVGYKASPVLDEVGYAFVTAWDGIKDFGKGLSANAIDTVESLGKLIGTAVEKAFYSTSNSALTSVVVKPFCNTTT